MNAPVHTPRNSIRRRLAAALSLAAALVTGPGLAAHAAAPTFGSMDVAVAVIPNLAYGGMAPAPVNVDGSTSYCLEACSIVDWQWSFGDGTGASGPQASHVYTHTGLYTLTLTVTANNGLTDTASALVNVATPTLAVMTTTPSRGYLPLSVAFDGTGSVTNWDRTLSYEWTFGDGATATGATATHVYTTPGVYNPSLKVTDSAGGYQIVGTYVYVQDPMAPPTSLRATSPTKGSVSLTWVNRMVAVDHLEIQRCTGSNCTSFTTISSLPGTSTSFTNSGLTSGKTYRYKIRVVDYLGNTGASSIVSVKVR